MCANGSALVQHNKNGWLMTAQGHSRRFRDLTAMSALPPIADLTADILDGSDGPTADIARETRTSAMGQGAALIIIVVAD
jgi:hypothetical protein